MTWQELKVEPVASGNYSDGTLSVTVTVVDTPSGPTFNWTSNIGVDAVFVKGGTDGTLYLYAPESTSGTGLHAPVNPDNGQYYGLSHISFCYDVDNAPATTTSTTTTAPATTTTTAPATTTTSMQNSPPTMGGTTTTTDANGTPPGSTTSTPPGSTTSTPPGASPTTVAGAALASAAGPMLPLTGQNTLAVAAAGLVLLGIGLAARTAARRA